MRVAVLTVVGILGSAGSALAWNVNGEHNGWDNKNERGCPTQYSPASADLNPAVDLNGDGSICIKSIGSGLNYVDDISNH
jgi:hypothetical protein